MALSPQPDEPDRREGRGRLCSIDLLPEEAEEDIAWANAELAARSMPQTEILYQFNARLADKGIGGISKGAFSRYSVRKALVARKHEAARAMTETVLGKLSPNERNDSTLAMTELLKHQIVEMVMAQEVPDPGMLGFACLSLQRLSLTAARASSENRIDRKAKADAKVLRKAARAHELSEQDRQETAEQVAQIASEAGLGAERIAAIRRGVLGIAT